MINRTMLGHASEGITKKECTHSCSSVPLEECNGTCKEQQSTECLPGQVDLRRLVEIANPFYMHRHVQEVFPCQRPSVSRASIMSLNMSQLNHSLGRRVVLALNRHVPLFIHYFFFLSFPFFCPPAGSPPPPPPAIPARPGGIPGIPSPPPCSSFIMSAIMLSLTPPPGSAGECRGRMLPILKPRGTAGAGTLLSLGIGRPGTRSFRGDCSLLGCDFKYVATIL